MDRRCQALVSKVETLATINFTRLKLANVSSFLYFFLLSDQLNATKNAFEYVLQMNKILYMFQ